MLVSVASGGSEGYHKALEYPPDLVVLDVQMPGWDGLRTLQEFRRRPPLTTVQVLMLTSDASRDTVLAAIHGGANDYLIKTNFSKDEFYRKLQRLLPGCLPAELPQAQPSAAEATASEPSIQPAHASNLHRTRAGAPREPISLGRDADDSRLQEILDAWE